MPEAVNEVHLKIKRAAGFEAVTTYPSLMQLLGYRKRIAEELLRCHPNDYLGLFEVFNNVNTEIKNILGL